MLHFALISLSSSYASFIAIQNYRNFLEGSVCIKYVSFDGCFNVRVLNCFSLSFPFVCLF